MSIRASQFTCVLMVGVAVAATIAGTGAPAVGASAGVPTVERQASLPMALGPITPTPMPTIGQPAPEKTPDAPVTLNSLHRDSSGFVALTWTMKYSGNSNSLMIPPSDWIGIYKYNGASISGITLIDESAQIRYNPLRMDPSQTCICTHLTSVPNQLSQGASAIYQAVYKLPMDVKSVTVNVPGYSPAKNTAIS